MSAPTVPTTAPAPASENPATATVATLATAFSTEDPERAHAYLRTTYVDHTMRITGSPEGFRMRHIHYDAGSFSSGILAHSMAVENRDEPLGYLLIGQVLEGRLEREAPDAMLRLSPGETLLFSSPDQPFTVRWDAVTMRMTRINLDVLRGLTPGDSPLPRFTGLRPTTAPQARHLAEVLNYVASDVLPNREAISHPLVVAETARLLATTVLSSFANTMATGSDRRDRADATPAALRRALTFIDNHAHTPITLADIADAARVTPRTVQLVFRRHLATTPTAHLRRVRLDRAHHDLHTADSTRGATVTAIAHRWGFSNPGRFATEYHAVYGHSPGHTLRA